MQAYLGKFRVAAATLLIGVSALATVAAPAAVFAEAHQVNPYVGATQYVNPLWKAEVESEAVAQPSLATKMRVVENQPTAVWQAATPELVTMFGSESGSMTAEIRRFA